MVDEMVEMNKRPVRTQSAVEDEKKKYETLSNASRRRHQTNKNTIQNLR